MDGNQVRCTEKIRISSVARKKYGMAWTNVITGSSDSSQPPRRQAARVPMAVPSTKLMTVARPTRTTVHQMCWLITVSTDVFPLETDTPRSPVRMLPQ